MTYPITHEGRVFTPAGEIEPPDVSTGMLNCGHFIREASSIAPGYTLIMGYTVCYACMDEWERQWMAVAPAYTGYIEYGSAPRFSRKFTTWTGGQLATITSISYSRPMWSQDSRPWRHVYVRATGPDGSLWWGHGSDAWNLITLHRCKNQPEA